ncbi:MAG: tellurite resistance TerB family protein [Rhodospirillaceae bacterium]|nr:tellurite resistance TerB family protein [Rhodospirillaceae bacterium]
MIDLNKMLGQVLGQVGQLDALKSGGKLDLGKAFDQGRGKAFAGGAVLGGLAGALSGKAGKKLASTALKLGGAAAIAGLAYTAYQRYQAGRTPAGAGAAPPAPRETMAGAPIDATYEEVPPAGTRFLPPPQDVAANNALSLKLIRAMIAAAKADGRINAAESGKIFAQIDDAGVTDADRTALMADLSRPQTPEDIARDVTCPEQAAEIYAASVLAVDRDGPAERDYLRRLAQALRLDPALTQELHARIDAMAA